MKSIYRGVVLFFVVPSAPRKNANFDFQYQAVAARM